MIENYPNIEVNEYQTPITEELFDGLSDKEIEEFFEFVTTIPYIQNLISPNRRRAKDMPHDEDGKVIIDYANPHILEDMDYFRPAALFYEKHGCYTLLKPNSNPNSEYRRFWDEERRRCRSGYVRPTDGEWVTGKYYFVLNYCPILLNKQIGNSRRANRVEGFPLVWEGAYLRFHYYEDSRNRGLHSIELSKRGCSKSISLAGFAAGNFILGINEEVTKLVKTFVVAAQSQYLDVSKDGTMAKFLPMINFIFENTPFPHLMLKNSSHDGEWQMGYKDENNREKGSLNTVTAVSVKDDPDKLRGKRGDMLFEEMGSFGNLLTVYNTSRSSVEEGDLTFGQIILVGTAGEDESDFSSAKTLLYNTEAHHIMSLKNVYDKPGQGKSTFGYFFPSYLNRPGCYNSDGVSDITKALVQVLMSRREARMSSNPRTVLKIIAEQPITPAEAIIKVKASYFPVIQLNERLLEIDTHPQILDSISVGDLYMDANGEVQFKQTNDLPIREYPVRNDNPGAVEIFEFPQKTNGKIISGRYIIGHDPVDNDSAESSSLTSTFVFDLFTDRIVAEYTGRRMFAEDNYEIVRLLCLFYNAQCLFESNKKGIYMYFSRLNCTYLLLDTPEHLREKGLIKYQAFGSNTKGVNANAIINAYANRLILDWMNKKNVIEYEDNGEYKVIETSNLYGIKSRALIMEAVAYRPEWNFDRIRALGMVMLAREEALILYGGNPASQQQEEEVYTDPFFERNNPFKKNNNDSFFA